MQRNGDRLSFTATRSVASVDGIICGGNFTRNSGSKIPNCTPFTRRNGAEEYGNLSILSSGSLGLALDTSHINLQPSARPIRSQAADEMYLQDRNPASSMPVLPFVAISGRVMAHGWAGNNPFPGVMHGELDVTVREEM